jgi:hypothetical protein
MQTHEQANRAGPSYKPSHSSSPLQNWSELGRSVIVPLPCIFKRRSIYYAQNKQKRKWKQVHLFCLLARTGKFVFYKNPSKK